MKDMLDAAVGVVRRLKEAGFEAMFAGGCVRDSLLGRPCKDYDVATNARPEQVQSLFPKSLGVGAHFGVILVRQGGFPIEVATFRRDGAYLDGRRPEKVEFTDAEEDAKRRDFTVNGMFYDPLAEKLIDYVGGQEDLTRRQLRAIGEPKLRFQEDYLRLLRAVRFATVLDFEIEPHTWAAVKAGAPQVAQISVERVREELNKILLHKNRLRGFDLLVESGLMQVILPEILDLQGCEQPPQWHPEGDVFKHTRLMIQLLPEEVSLSLVLSVLLHDIAKPATFTVDETGRIRFNGHDKLGAEMTESILRRLKYPNDTIERTRVAVANHMGFKDVQKMKVSTLKRFMGREGFSDELALHRVDCLSSNGLLDNYEFLKHKLDEFEDLEQGSLPKPWITGHDLMKRGMKSGRALGDKLTELHNKQLEGTWKSREEAMLWLEQQPLS